MNSLGFFGIALGMAVLLWLFLDSRNDYDIRKIKVGMSKSEVVGIFGNPHSIDDGEWVWTRPMSIFAAIRFDSDGRVYSTYRTGPPCAGEVPK